MIIKQLTLATLDTGTLDFGFVGENEHIKFVIKCDSVFDEYPTATASLLIKAPDNTIYPKVVEVEGNNVGWVITASDTAHPGSGQIQLTFTEDGAVVKTVIADTNIKDSLVGDDPPPDPIADWISNANQILNKVDGMTATAESLPSGDDPSVTVETVDGHYNLEFGIPAGDPGDPTEIIDDTAGVGDTTKVWSANKSATDLSELKSDIDQKAPVINETASGDIVSFADGADGMPLSSCVVSIDPVQSGTGDPSPENVRPLIGLDGCSIYQVGTPVNLFDGQMEPGEISTTTGENSGSSTSRSRSVNYIPYREDLGSVYFHCPEREGNFRIFYYGAAKNFIGYNSVSANAVVTIPQGLGIRYLRFRFGSGAIADDQYISVNVPSTATGYIPHSVQTYPISWQTAAGTVYGGKINPLTGVLTVDRACVTFDGSSDELWYRYTNTEGENASRFRITLTDRKTGTGINGTQVADYLKTTTGDFTSGNSAIVTNNPLSISLPYDSGRIWINATGLVADPDSIDDWRAYLELHPLTVCYLIAEPYTVQLDPVQIKTLMGYNAIWSDTGAVAVTYPADTKQYVDDSIPSVPVQDVQINGTSILSDGVANVPIGSSDTVGVVKSGVGIGITNAGQMYLINASDTNVKSGTIDTKAIAPINQHSAAFYGLAKAAGADMASSSNPVGTYTDAAKVAIQKMLGVYQAPWELIREDTFTNATAATHEITVDGNGNPFELTSAVLMFETPVQNAESSANGNLIFTDGTSFLTSQYCGNWSQSANAAAHGCWIVADERDGLVFVITKQQSSSTNANNLSQSYAEGLSSGSTQCIREKTGFIIRGAKIAQVLGTGHYKLYGRRKWN